MIGWYATHTWQAVTGVVIIAFSVGCGFIPAHIKSIWQRLLISACCLATFCLVVFLLSKGINSLSVPAESSIKQ